MFHSDFAERDTLLPIRVPSSCFLTIKGMACLCLFTQQYIKSCSAVVPEQQVKHSLQTHLKQRKKEVMSCVFLGGCSPLMIGVSQTDSVLSAAIQLPFCSF